MNVLWVNTHALLIFSVWYTRADNSAVRFYYVNSLSVAPIALVSAYQLVLVLTVTATQLWCAPSLRDAYVVLSPEAQHWLAATPAPPESQMSEESER